MLLEDAVASSPEGATSEPDVVASAPWAHAERPSRWQRLIICRRHTVRRLPAATHAAIVSRHPRRHRRPMEEASAEVTSVDIAKTASQSPRPAADILRPIFVTSALSGFYCGDVKRRTTVQSWDLPRMPCRRRRRTSRDCRETWIHFVRHGDPGMTRPVQLCAGSRGPRGSRSASATAYARSWPGERRIERGRRGPPVSACDERRDARVASGAGGSRNLSSEAIPGVGPIVATARSPSSPT